MSPSNILQIVYEFLGWVKAILNALGITSLDENIDNARAKLTTEASSEE